MPSRSRRKRTLLSFQRPALLGDVKKPPTRARGPGMLGNCVVSVASEGRSSVEVQGLPYATLSGSRGMIAAVPSRSSAAEPHEPAFPGLDDRALEPRAREVELGGCLTVDLHPSLADQTPRFARRGNAEMLDEE